MDAPLRIDLEFVRTERSEDPYAFSFDSQTYLLRGGGGAYEAADLDWAGGWLESLARLQGDPPDPSLATRIGRRLRGFLYGAHWEVHEQQIERAVARGEPVELVIRSSAAELYALPWELLTLRSTGQHLGELPDVTIRYEWPGTRTAARIAAPPRLLYAWSAGGGSVPAGEHLHAVRAAARSSGAAFDEELDVVPHATLGRLAVALGERRPTVLHLLGHGMERDGLLGIALNGDAEACRVIDASALRRVVGPHAATLRTVVICACRSGDSDGPQGSLGSLAQGLHRAGIENVVASRFRIRTGASIVLARTFFAELLAGHGIDRAFGRTRRALTAAPGLTWATLQLHRRADPASTRSLLETQELPGGMPDAVPVGKQTRTLTIAERSVEEPTRVTAARVERPGTAQLAGKTWWARVEDGRATGLVVQLRGRQVRIGAGRDSDLVLTDEGISRRHGTLRLGEGWTFTDDGSTNGSLLGGRPVTPRTPAPITAGSVLQLGPISLSVGSAEDLGLEPRRCPAIDVGGRRLPVPPGGLVLGRLDDDGVIGVGVERLSRRHVAVEPSRYGLLVRDLESTNGTTLGSVAVARAPTLLPPGAVLLLAGEVEVRIA